MNIDREELAHELREIESAIGTVIDAMECGPDLHTPALRLIQKRVGEIKHELKINFGE